MTHDRWIDGQTHPHTHPNSCKSRLKTREREKKKKERERERETETETETERERERERDFGIANNFFSKTVPYLKGICMNRTVIGKIGSHEYRSCS